MPRVHQTHTAYPEQPQPIPQPAPAPVYSGYPGRHVAAHTTTFFQPQPPRQPRPEPVDIRRSHVIPCCPL